MKWDVEFHDDFYQEFLEFPEIVKTEILAKAEPSLCDPSPWIIANTILEGLV